jgi:hypothetical protein
MDRIDNKQIFNQIFDSLDRDEYTRKTIIRSAFGLKPAIPIELSIRNPERKEHASLLKNLLNEARKHVRKNNLSAHQGLAIEKLIRLKRDELAQKKFLEKRKRTFKTQGTEYELVDMGHGDFSCVNKKEYRKRNDGKWESIKGDPKDIFGSGATADPLVVDEKRIFAIDHFLGHRLDAYYMRNMCDADFLPNYTPLRDKQQAEVELRHAPDGAFLIFDKDNESEEYCAIIYKMGGQIIHELFNKETGIMKSHENDPSPRTIFNVLNNLQAAEGSQQHTIKRGPIPDQSGANPRSGTARHPKRKDATSPATVGVNGAYISLPDFFSSDPNSIRPGPNSTKRVHHHDAINAKNAPSPKNLTIEEIEARKIIENYDLDYHKNGLALPYRQRNGDHYALIRIKTKEGQIRNFKLPYDPYNKSVVISDRKMSIDEFLLTKGICADGACTFLVPIARPQNRIRSSSEEWSLPSAARAKRN